MGGGERETIYYSYAVSIVEPSIVIKLLSGRDVGRRYKLIYY